jgi:hypothetical protein
MSVWYAIPSARPAAEANKYLTQWQERGYKVALQLDAPDHQKLCDWCVLKPWEGYAKAVNGLVRNILEFDPQAEWIVTGGDDIQPDLAHTAEEIAQECTEYLFRLHERQCLGCKVDAATIATFGVMQPTGDRWGESEPWARQQFPNAPAYIDRICGSPWMGREFCRRMYQGNGPLFEGYQHMYVDEELQCVAQSLGILWQRTDLIHYHNHWGRKDGAVPPEFLKDANSQEHWRKYGQLFRERKSAGFPGHQPICGNQRTGANCTHYDADMLAELENK